VDSIKISVRDVLVAFAAGVHDFKPEGIFIGPFDRVGGVTIIARR